MKNYEKIIFEESLPIIDEQLNTNRTKESDRNNDIINNHFKNNKGIDYSNSSISSFSFFSSLSFFNKDIIEEENANFKSELCNCNNLNNIYLIKAFWYYHMIEQHNLIELNLHCIICNNKYIIYFHKTALGKDKKLISSHIKDRFFMRWLKRPKKRISYAELLNFYNKESNNYNLLFNNCYNFAKSIWNKID